MSNEIVVTLLDSGIPSLIGGNVDFFNVDLNSFIIGDAVDFAVNQNETTPRGATTFIGSKSLLKLKMFNDEKSLKVMCIIPEEYNDIKIGNIMIYAFYKGAIKPFASIVFSEQITKLNPSSNIVDQNFRAPGNRMVINLNINYVDANTVIADYVINILTPNFANLPYFGTDFDLPLAQENPHSQFVVNEMNSLGNRPTFVTKTQDGEGYWASPIFQNIASPKFGVLNSFEADFYNNIRVTWVWGQTFSTPDAAYRGIVGGCDFLEQEEMTVIGGLDFNESL